MHTRSIRSYQYVAGVNWQRVLGRSDYRSAFFLSTDGSGSVQVWFGDLPEQLKPGQPGGLTIGTVLPYLAVTFPLRGYVEGEVWVRRAGLVDVPVTIFEESYPPECKGHSHE